MIAGRIGMLSLAIAWLVSGPAFAQQQNPQPPFFTPGNLVVAVAGCGTYGATCTNVPYGTGTDNNGVSNGSYGDDQGSPWTLFQYIPNGASGVTFVNSLQLPQNISGANYPISNDYGSQSEGTVQLSGNGLYLTMMGYGLNAATFNGNFYTYCPGSTPGEPSTACVPENGNPAMAQTGNLTAPVAGVTGTTAVPRVVALIDANGNVNSSTVLYNIFDENDARSAYSPDGVNLYVSGQGCKTCGPIPNQIPTSGDAYDNTSGVYYTPVGVTSNAPTPITGNDNGPTGCDSTSTCTSSEDTRMVQIYNNTLYVSSDAKPGGTGYNRSYIGTLGDPAATSLFTCTGVGGGCGTGYGPYGPAEMPGFGNTGGTGKYTLNTAGSGNNSNGNNLNVGLAVNLSPQNFFFASPTVLYVADTGSPKNTSNGPDSVCTSDNGKDTVGDGGLQKWILNPTVTAAVTSGSTTVTAPLSGAFTQGEVGLPISGPDIPAGTTITAVSSAGKTATISAGATATNSTESVTVSGWSLVYTLYNGLNLVLNSDCDPSSPTTQGSLSSTGLYGLAGVVNNGVATLYVTNYPNNDLVQTYLYGITDTLATTTMTSPGTAFTVLDTAPEGSVFRGVSFVPQSQNGDVAITSVVSGVPTGLTVTTSGTGCAPSTFTTPSTQAWTPGSTCTLSVVSPQSPAGTPPGTQYAFSQWQDGTTNTADIVTAPSSTANSIYTYTATFTTQYQLTTAAGTGGMVSPPSGYYNSGTNVPVTATPSAGYYFVNFTGTTTSTSNPLTIEMTAPQSITANFAAIANQTITFGALANQTYGAAPFMVSATASSGLPVSFASLTSTVCTVSGTTVTLVQTGTCTIQATQAGNTAYAAAPPVNQSFQVLPATPVVSFTGAPPTAPYEATFTVTATTNSGATPTITASGPCSISGTTVTITAPSGTCAVTAIWPANTNYLGATVFQNTIATQASPAINWATPAAITYGTALSGTQLNATATYNGASVAGTFVYTPAKGTVLTAGSQTLSVSFTPNKTADFTSASGSVTLQVNQATPKITWTKPAAITYGTALSSTQLDATASVPGTFVYSPAAGTVLTAGAQTLSVTFTPTDTTDYATTTDAVTITVNTAAPTITWATPAPIVYGTALSATQLDATASVPGAFVYSPAAGAIPAGGSDTLKVTFTPTDTTDYTTATASVTLQVTPATPAINWSTPAPITYGTALSGAQLNATATFNSSSVGGTFVYTPAKGTVLGAGSQTLSVTFTPNNTANYTSASASVTLQVNQATPTITWPKPAAITYPTPLSSTQLDATASVPGTFVYSPPAGTVLSVGTGTLSVTFTPTDTVDYTTATDTVTITVKQ